MTETIILIGPIGVGKTTQAKLLSKKLKMPMCSYDSVKSGYWNKLGLQKEDAESIEREYGTYAMLSYMNEYKSKAVASIINDYSGHIIDLDGGDQTFDEPHQIELVQKAMDPIKNVFLLLPASDVAKSINHLPGLKEDFAINAYLITHPTNEVFAKKTLYTLGKSSNEIMEEIVGNL